MNAIKVGSLRKGNARSGFSKEKNPRTGFFEKKSARSAGSLIALNTGISEWVL